MDLCEDLAEKHLTSLRIFSGTSELLLTLQCMNLYMNVFPSWHWLPESLLNWWHISSKDTPFGVYFEIKFLSSLKLNTNTYLLIFVFYEMESLQ